MQILLFLHLLDTALGNRHTTLSGTGKLSVLVKFSKQLKHRVFSAMREAVPRSFITETHTPQQGWGKLSRKKKKKVKLTLICEDLNDKLEEWRLVGSVLN